MNAMQLFREICDARKQWMVTFGDYPTHLSVTESQYKLLAKFTYFNLNPHTKKIEGLGTVYGMTVEVADVPRPLVTQRH